MKFGFKQVLIASTALVAITVMTSPAFAADEFRVDANNSGSFTTTAPDETADSVLDYDAGTTGGGATVASHDLQVISNGGVTFDNNVTIGDGTTSTPGIVAGANNQTLTITNNTNDNDTDTLTVAGGISTGPFTALNVVLVGNDADNVADLGIFNINGNVNLGTGTLQLNSGINTNNDIALFLTGNMTAASITLNANGADAVLNFNGATAQTVNANIIGSVASAGDDINITNATTFNGVVGQGVAVDTVTTSANTVFNAQANLANDLVFSGNSTVTFAPGLVNIGDDILTNTDSTGNVVFLGAGTVGGDIGVDGAELAGLTLSGNNTTVTSQNLQAADATRLGTNTLAVTGTVDFDAGQTLFTTVTAPASAGHITATGAATVDAGTRVVINVDNTGNFIANGQTFNLIDATGGTGVADLTPGNITDNSFLLAFSQVTTDDANLVVTANRTSTATAGDTRNNRRVGQSLETLGLGGTADIDALQGALNAANTSDEVNDILESLLPVTDAAVRSTVDSARASLDMTGHRLAGLRNGQTSDQTGMPSGEFGDGLRAWMQGFGQSADQDRRDNSEGYEADTLGAAFGIDTENLYRDLTVGMGFSYGNTDVDTDGINNSDIDIDSYQVSLYGDYRLPAAMYVEGMLAYAYNDIDQTRRNVGTIAGLNADSDYSSDQYIAYVETGKAFEIANDTFLTPSALAHYQHISVEGYTENGAGGLGLDVDSENFDILEFGVGAELAKNFMMDDGSKLRPAINAGYRYDVIGDNVETTSNFTGGGPSFRTEGFDPAQSAFNIGASVTWAKTDNWDLTADYDYDVKSDYDSHSGFIRAGHKF